MTYATAAFKFVLLCIGWLLRFCAWSLAGLWALVLVWNSLVWLFCVLWNAVLLLPLAWVLEWAGKKLTK